ncbi:STAS/SEC14 domain-containing protein [Ramlibacter pallidus]|uniref:STAS/SEC14 domain-containing protein n=1 Tax=Ramlibacter pallidus TaxID=2780087 RepID=A0ABR9S5L3_9BURK|nr:STAS/SEC14 domain-containing protein [Ramlibacter pallidus]MBE7368802.1 STAS/SEC14 domain-containing protein [Ramlibacter pallidus]
MNESDLGFDLAIDPGPHFIRVTVTGQPSLGQLLSLIHLLGVESETWKVDRVLVDLRSVTTPFSRQEQFRIGEEAAASLSHMEKIASVVPPERVTRVSEKAARRNGANVSVFDDEQAAMAWLREA